MIDRKPNGQQGRRHSAPVLPITEMQALAIKSQNTCKTDRRLSSDNEDKLSSKSRYSELSDQMTATNTVLDKKLQNELKIMKREMEAACNNISILQKRFQNRQTKLHSASASNSRRGSLA